MKTVAVIGASRDREKYGNRAVRSYQAEGYRVVPIHPTATEIEGLAAYPSVLDVPETMDMVSLYVPPAVGVQVMKEIAKRGIREVWLNPGADGPEVIRVARALGIEPVVACSLVALAVG